MRRKLVQQGPSTLMVSVPKTWRKKNALKKGQEVIVEDHGSHLLVYPDDSAKPLSVHVGASDESTARAAIVNAYRCGYNRFTIHFDSKKQLKIINDTIRDYLTGVEVVSFGPSSCVVESVTEPSGEQFEAIFRKIFHSISYFIQNTSERLLGKADFSEYDQVMFKIHRFDNFCRRVIAKQKVHIQFAQFYVNFLSHMVHCPRELYHLNRFLDKKNIRFRNKKILSSLSTAFSLLQNAYFTKDLKEINSLQDVQRKSLFEEFSQGATANSSMTPVLFHLYAAIRNLHLASSPLAGLLYEEGDS